MLTLLERKAKDMPNYFVWGVTQEPTDFALIRNDLLQKGKLRQGWGCNGMDIRNSYQTYAQAWQNMGWGLADCQLKYNALKKMLKIKPGDVIIIKNIHICDTKPNYTPWGFTLATCSKPYDFSPLVAGNGRHDFGHFVFVDVKSLKSYDCFDGETRLGRALQRLGTPIKIISKHTLQNALYYLGCIIVKGKVP